MGSSKSNRCFIRKRELVDTPEERVRQALLHKMVGELGFPKGLLSVERGIGGRRTDIVCYTKEMAPLLLVECKAGPLHAGALQQALGYNETVGAPFLCLAKGEEVHTYWFEGTKRVSIPFLPCFKDLYAVFQRR
ncbi:MAG: type I restriction enzyme HsdR N-terminal domain-containing protein [Verrucomicrobia bacterium]|nr:type I restriction enzyme HsdR N-terminal domain-containing protein [Verrucomicrobiota bacterium]